MTPPDAPGSDTPASIGRYKIVERLAAGAAGEVYKGFDPVLQRPLAIKLLRLSSDAQQSAAIDRIKERFYRDIQRVAALVHPSIARLFDGGDVPGALFMASEFLESTSLAEVIAQGRALDRDARIAILRQIAGALEYARENDTPHLNLRTTNILMCADQTVKVGGFGTARVLESLSAPPPGTARTTPPWVTRFTAPEVVAGEDADARADVFSFAAVAAELFGGSPVTPADSFPAQWTREGMLLAMPAIGSKADMAAAGSVLARALSPDVERRYPNVGDCFDALRMALGVTPEKAKSWETPAAAAGITSDQLKQIESAPTQFGVPTFVKKVSTDSDETSAGRTVADELDAPTMVDREAPPLPPLTAKAPTAPQPPAAAPPAVAAPPAAATVPPPAAPIDPSEVKTILMPAPPKSPRFEKPTTSAPPIAPADADAGKTILVPRKKPEPVTPPTAPAAASAAPIDPSEVKTTLMPNMPRAPQFVPAAPPAPPAASAPPAPAAASDQARTLMLDATDARGAAPPPPAPKAPPATAAAVPPAAVDPSKTAPRLTAPPPLSPVPPPPPPPKSAAPPPPAAAVAAATAVPPAGPRPPVSFPPPPPAPAPRPAGGAPPASKKSSGGGGVVLLLLAVLVILAIGGGAAWYALPSFRQLFTRERPSPPPATSAPTTSAVVATPPVPAPATPVSTPPVSAPPASETPATPPLPVTEAPAGGTPGAARPTAGSLRIASTPPGAAVSIDGQRRGVTPLRVNGIAFGNHTVEVALDGYASQTQSVSLSAQRASRNVDVRLSKAAAVATTGAVAVTTDPAGARILVDGSLAGTSPLTVANLSPGKHAVQAEREGFESAMREVDVRAGDTAPLSLKLTAGSAKPAAPLPPAGAIPFEAVETKPRQTRGPASPPYPRAAAQARLAGVVELSWIVDETGAVSDVQVLQSTSKIFENDVVAWARSLRYSPGQQGGRPVKVRFSRRFSFEPR